jgi:hypothetical protein
MSAFTDPDGYRRGFNGDTRGGTSSVGYRNGALAKDSIDRAYRQGPYAPTSTPTTPFVSSGRVTPINSGSGGYYAGGHSSSVSGVFSFLGKIIGFGFLVLIVLGIIGNSNKTTPQTPAPGQNTASTAEDQKWPDGTLPADPTKWMRAHPINLAPADPSLKLRPGPGMKTGLLVKIPANANDIIVFTSDWVPNGPTQWYRAIWRGYRGYVGGGFIQANGY